MPNHEDEFESGRLFELYTKYVTEPESKQDVYGYTILVVGYLLGMVGMAIYLLGPGRGALTPVTIVVRRIAFPAAGLGLVITLLGIVLLLPVRTKGVVVGILGAAMGIAAAGWFVVAYPANWGVGAPDHSTAIVTLYTIGVALVAGVVVMVPVVTGERSYFAAAREVLSRDQPDIMVGDADRAGHFTIFKRDGEWTWRLLDQEAVAASTEGFLSRLETEDRVERIKARVEQAGFIEITHAAFRLYQIEGDRWRWLLMRSDGNVVADSGDAYPTRGAAEESVHELKEFGPAASVISIDEAAFETYPDNGEWRWRLIDHQRQTLTTGANRHASQQEARRAIEAFSEHAGRAPQFTVNEFGIELYADADEWYWRLLTGDFEPLLEGTTGYAGKSGVEHEAYELLDELSSAEIIDGRKPAYDVFRPEADRWEWRLVTPEQRTIAVGTETGASKERVVEDARVFKEQAPGAETIEIRDQDFELFRSSGAWHWRLVTGDRTVRAHSVEAYGSQSAVADAIEQLRRHAPDADLIEFETAAFQIYEAEDGHWRWRLIDEDGNVLADSSEGEYESRDSATAAMATLKDYAPEAEQLEIETAAFELFEEAGEWGWRLVDDIGETIARGERRYESRGEAQSDMDALRDEVTELGSRVMKQGVFQVYPDGDDEWWWRFIRPDGSVVAESAHGYGTRHEAEEAVETLLDEHVTGEIVTVGQLAVLLEAAGSEIGWKLVDYARAPIAEGTTRYGTDGDARSMIASIQSRTNSITVFEIRGASFVVTNGDEWRWRLIDEDHTAIAAGPEPYPDRDRAEAAVATVQNLAPEAELVEFETAAFEVLETPEREWRWRLIDEQRTAIASSTQTTETREAVLATIEAIREELGEASILEIDRAAFEFHRDEAGWQWRLIDATGNELAASLEAYETRTEAREALNVVKTYAPSAWTAVAE